MILGFNYCTRRSSVFRISKIKIMDKCYFRHIQDEERIEVSFFLKIKESVRQFNLSRKPDESVSALLTRIGTNVQKVLNKGTKKNKIQNVSEVTVALYNVNDEHISVNHTCKDLFNLEQNMKLKINDNIYEAVFNAPWVVNIALPESILVGFPVYPEHFKTLNTIDNKNVFNWYSALASNEKGNEIADVHIKWQLVGTGFVYIPSIHDIGRKLKIECIPGKHFI